MDVLKLLKQDHDTVRALFSKFDAEKGAKRRRIVEQLRTELLRHARVEEEIVYPAVRDVIEDLSDVILEAHEEHHVVERCLEDLASVDPSDERFEAKVAVMRNLVLQHVEWEEAELFPRIRRAMDLPLRRELGDEVESAKSPDSTPLGGDGRLSLH